MAQSKPIDFLAKKQAADSTPVDAITAFRARFAAKPETAAILPFDGQHTASAIFKKALNDYANPHEEYPLLLARLEAVARTTHTDAHAGALRTAFRQAGKHYFAQNDNDTTVAEKLERLAALGEGSAILTTDEKQTLQHNLDELHENAIALTDMIKELENTAKPAPSGDPVQDTINGLNNSERRLTAAERIMFHEQNLHRALRTRDLLP